MVQKFDYVELNQTQIDFLKEYTPKCKGFTSILEMKKIISKFGLDENIDVERMRGIRNSVVRFYSDLHKGFLIGGEEKLNNVMEAMYSVTTVIDYQMYKVNPMSV